MQTNKGDSIAVLMYYSPNASGTVISPTDAVIRNTSYTTWVQVADIPSKKGFVKFLSSTGIQSDTVPLYMYNNLWYFDHSSLKKIHSSYEAINILSQDLMYKL